MKKRYLSTAFALLCFLLGAQAQIDLTQPLAKDNDIVRGKLPNGISYYLLHNNRLPQRASFYLIRNAGSLLEEDNQNGLAHFLEHMAFQGTLNFPGNGIVSGLEKHGVSFGQNINAYTGQDETVYNLSDVPTGSPSLLDTCLLILHDWSYYLTLDEKEIDKERGVIAEEWRTRHTPDFRIQQQTLPYVFKGSRYATRDIIGSLDVINHFRPQTLRNFYHRWYRTDLEAIAVVGDIDVKAMEEKIKKLFATIPAEKKPVPRPIFEIPDHDETFYVLATDKEAGRPSLGLSIRFKDTADNTRVGYLKENLITTLYNSMMKRRIGEQLMQQADPPFVNGSVTYTKLVRGYNAYNLSATAKPGEEARAWRAILTENERVRRYGFTPEELQRAKQALLARLEAARSQQGQASNESHLRDIQEEFLTGKPAVNFGTYYGWARLLIDDITPEEVSAKAREWNSTRNRIVVVTGSSEDNRHLTREQAFALMDSVARDTGIKPYTDQAPAPRRALIGEPLKGGKIVATRQLPAFDATEWTLDNGARVVFRKSASDKQSVLLSSYSKGGTSLYDTDLLPAAENAASMMNSFGLGDFTPAEMQKLLAGKTASSRVNIGNLSESVGGASAPQDIETLLQLLYLRFEHPRFDNELFQATMSRNRSMLPRLQSNPQHIMQDSIQQIMADHNPRALLFDEKYLDAITPERLQQVYRDRIKDASDFVFFIVGHVDEARLKPLVEKYIGSIPSVYRKETWRDNHVHVPKGKTERVIRLDTETPKATVIVNFSHKLDYTPYHNVCNSVLQSILQLRYTETIREAAGGTYNVSVGSASASQPESLYSLNIQFECDPAKVSSLKPLVYAETERLTKEGPTAEELEKVLTAMKKNSSQSKYSNSYWMSVLTNYYIEGLDMTDPKNFDRILDTLTPKDVQKFAKQLFKKADVVDLVFSSK